MKHLMPYLSRQCVSMWNKDMKRKRDRKRKKEINLTAPCPQEIHCPSGKTKIYIGKHNKIWLRAEFAQGLREGEINTALGISFINLLLKFISWWVILKTPCFLGTIKFNLKCIKWHSVKNTLQIAQL